MPRIDPDMLAFHSINTITTYNDTQWTTNLKLQGLTVRKKRVSRKWTHGNNFKCCSCVVFFLIEGRQPSFYAENNSSLSFFRWIPFLPATIFFSSPTFNLVSCRASTRLETPSLPCAFRQDVNNHTKMPHPGQSHNVIIYMRATV